MNSNFNEVEDEKRRLEIFFTIVWSFFFFFSINDIWAE